MDDIFNNTTENSPAPQEPIPQEPISAPQPTPQPVQPPVTAYNSAPVNQNPINPTPIIQQPQAQPYQPQPVYKPATPPKQKKQKTSAGKVAFILIICVCIEVATIMVGFGFTGKKATNSQNAASNGEFAADAVMEDSPVSYSKYSGKGPMTAEQVYKEVKDINVGIIVYSQKQKVGEGSGIIVGESKDKKATYVITAAHVIANSGETVQVQFNDGSETDATVVGVDEKTDVGVLKINKTGLKKATFGNSTKLSVGQTVYAIGNPGGSEFFGSFTSGTISAIDRPVPTTNSSYDLPCIQHDAAINPGNSGGALVNEYGQIIGLNSSKISSTDYEGMGFAVPSQTVLEVYNEIIKNGYVSNRPMLGITYFPVSTDYNYSAIAWKNNLPYGSIVIATISSSSDIANHGIREGDIITAVNGKKLENTDILLEAIEKGKVGDKIELTVCRLNNSGKIEKTFKAKIALVEDKGDNKVPETTTQPTDPFSGYFENFGY